MPPNPSEITLFEQAYPYIKVEGVADASRAKYVAVMAAGTPPDVMQNYDDSTNAEWAETGLAAALDSYWTTDKFSKDDVFVPVWNNMHYKGHVWALPLDNIGTFSLFYNKDLFAQLGIKGPPQTIPELDDLNTRFYQTENDGSIKRLGMEPNMVSSWGGNAMYSWGYDWGGSFYDEQTQKVTADDPQIVAALEWMAGYGKRWGVDRVSKFVATFGKGQALPFLTGKFAMQFGYQNRLNDVLEYAPSFNLGAAWIPAGPPPKGETHSDWTGGFTLVQPPGTKHPDESWLCIKFCTSDPRATDFMWGNNWTPGWKNTPTWQKIVKDVANDPVRRLLVDMVTEGKHARASFAASSFLYTQLTTAINNAWSGKMSAREALQQATTLTQVQLEKILPGSKIKEGSIS
jgi:multiple sugar transport system substrate-binding protein